MASNTALPEGAATNIEYYHPADPDEAAEFDSFLALLPQLRESNAGQYVAVRAGRVIASGMYADPVIKLARCAVGGAAFYCGWVEPPGGSVFRFGSPTLVLSGATC